MEHARIEQAGAGARFVNIGERCNVTGSAKFKKLIVEGDGVVGQTPYLRPGEEFSYNSYHVVAMDSAATGSFLALTDEGQAVVTRIPRFEMQVP